jgi:hypothetical protein
LSIPPAIFTPFTTEGPFGASGFLYLNSVPAPLAAHSVFGSARLTGPPPASKVMVESAPPTAFDPAMLMLGSLDCSTNLPVLSKSFVPVMPWSVAFAVPMPSSVMAAEAVMSAFTALCAFGVFIPAAPP